MQDRMNCLKNLIRLMCCDGRIAGPEKRFLARAARKLEVEVTDWSVLVRDVRQDGTPLFPVADRRKAIAALKAMVVMARVDKQVDEGEKRYIQHFAKSIGVSNEDWRNILQGIDVRKVFEPFRDGGGKITAIREDFERIDDFISVAKENGAQVKTVDMAAYLRGIGADAAIVCFHAAEDTQGSVDRCVKLLDRAGEKLVCILNRYQGLQVQYLLELGLRKCIIEPVYAQDIHRIWVQ